MIEAMPRPRPPHLHREVTRHGKTVWYVRVGKGARIRLKAQFGSPEFTPNTKPPSPARRGRRRERRPPGRSRGCSRATGRQRPGRRYPRRRGGSARTSSCTSSPARATSRPRGSPPRPSPPAGSAVRARRPKRAISSMLCAACLHGPRRAGHVKSDPDARREEPAAQEGRRLHPLDRGARRRL